MPPGRTPIATDARRPEPARPGARRGTRLRAEVAAGHQAYVVCPLVEDKGQGRSQGRDRGVRAAAGRGAARACASGLLHGQMPSKDKEVGDARVPRRRARRARRDDGDRGRCRRAERDRDGRRGRRPVRPVAAAPAARAGRARRRRVVLLPVRRPDDRRRRGSGWRRWPRRTDGFALAEKDLEIRGAGEVFGEKPVGVQRPEARAHPARRGRS